MSPENQLQLDKTFEEQRNLVNSIIVPTVMKSLDPNTFPIAETIVYEMVHNRHKHRREEYLTKQRSERHQNEQLKRKHLNSRRNDVSN
jgi:hypothetical protein